MTRTIVCPYCFSRFPARELRLRCPALCDVREVFVPGPGPEPACPHGRRPDSLRVCRSCTYDLHADYLQGSHNLIAMIGDQASGKTTYIGVLLHELQNRVGRLFDEMSVDLVGEESRRYQDEHLEVIMTQRQLPRATTTAATRADRRHEPLLFVMRFPRRGPLRRVRSALTVFYDTAGEESQRPENMTFLADYLGAAAGVLVVVDAGELVDTGKHGGTSGRQPLLPLTLLAERLRDQRRRGRGRLSVPLAVVISKIDLILDQFPAASPLHRESPHQGFFDANDGVDVHEELRGWMHRQGWAGVDRSLNNSFRTYRYFGVSALGQPPVAGNLVAEEGPQPLRVEDPMLWLLSRFGAVPSKKARR